MQAKLFKASGEVIPVDPKNGTDFQYDELTRFVGGLIEVIHPPSKKSEVLFVINEEGKIIGLPVNVHASNAWMQGCDPGSMRAHDLIVGDVLVCHATQVK